jgi:hypothetical protein
MRWPRKMTVVDAGSSIMAPATRLPGSWIGVSITPCASKCTGRLARGRGAPIAGAAKRAWLRLGHRHNGSGGEVDELDGGGQSSGTSHATTNAEAL